MWYEDRNFRIGLAIVIVVVGAVIVATSGDSIAVHWLAALRHAGHRGAPGAATQRVS